MDEREDYLLERREKLIQAEFWYLRPKDSAVESNPPEPPLEIQ